MIATLAWGSDLRSQISDYVTIILVKNKKIYFILAGIGLGLVVIFLTGFYVIPRVLVSISRASSVSKISISNSYVIGSKILAKADGVDKCVVNVFLVDNNGKGVVGRNIVLSGMNDIKAINNGVTDKFGNASFELISKIEGQFKMSATVDGVPLPKELTVIFRN